MNLNLSASVNVFRLLARPSLCMPQAVVPTFGDLPIPLDGAFSRAQRPSDGARPDIRAVVLDKDDCFAEPDSSAVLPAYRDHFARLRKAYPGRRLLIVSNTAGALSYDGDGALAAAVERDTGVAVLPHRTKKPGCGDEILAYFRQHPETGVTDASQIAVVGDRLTTDVMLANLMGGWAVWVRDGVVPLAEKSILHNVPITRAARHCSANNNGVTTRPVCICIMGGKVWSDEEERVFWSEIVPTSSKRHLLAKPYTDDAKGWESLRKVMQASMGRRARRKYTALMLYEHYFQNSVLERFSPNAARYVRDYIRNERSSTGQAPSERSRSVMRFVQRGSGSGRRPKNAHASQSQDLDQQDENQAHRQNRPQQNSSRSTRTLSSPVPRQLQLQFPLPLPSSPMPPPPPPPAPVRLPPLSAMELPLYVCTEESALCEPDYDFNFHYKQPTYEMPPFVPPSTYQPPDNKAAVFTAPIYTATAYAGAIHDGPVYRAPVSRAPVHGVPTYKVPSHQTPISRGPTPADDSLFVKQEVPVPEPEDFKVPVHRCEELHRQDQMRWHGELHRRERLQYHDELQRSKMVSGEWYE
ncbi:yhr100cp-like protein [Grosmannia clavigera kw1407]|uniref:Yhr100cp-like protein n=1 Tax=Grosmannia clavigera (strain kw1407 / UAMH 11150) TaxID=655863 RepID=F0XEN5_GROCL|nr:yhr100cp-like protein [Grosmannia clavigera kw1407]EFX04348.1 yhr100cp-like protein [Grosmannia clavigera kw1407]